MAGSSEEHFTVDEQHAFNPAACGGAPLASGQASPLVPGDGSELSLGTTNVVVRRRDCGSTGCGAWQRSGRLRAGRTKVEVRSIRLTLRAVGAEVEYRFASDVRPGFAAAGHLPQAGLEPSAPLVTGGVWLDPPGGPNITAARGVVTRITRTCGQFIARTNVPVNRSRYVEIEAAALFANEPLARTMTVEGELTSIQRQGGGASTGVALRTPSGLYALLLDDPERARFVDGATARVRGYETLDGGDPTIEVTELLACPPPAGGSPSCSAQQCTADEEAWLATCPATESKAAL